MPYVATINTPGYLPWDDEPPIFETAQEAWEYLAEQRRQAEDEVYDGGPDDGFSETVHELERLGDDPASGEGSIHGETPDYERFGVGHDLGLAYSVTWTDEEVPD